MVEAERGVSRIDLPKPKTDSTSCPGKLPSDPVTSIFSTSFSLTLLSSCANACVDNAIAVLMVNAFARGDNLNVVFFMVSSVFLVAL